MEEGGGGEEGGEEGGDEGVEGEEADRGMGRKWSGRRKGRLVYRLLCIICLVKFFWGGGGRHTSLK